MTVGELNFEQSLYEFDLPELGRLTLQCPKKKEVDRDIVVRAFEKELYLSDFARALPSRKSSRAPYSWVANIDYALGGPRCPVAVLVGEMSSAVVNFRDRLFDGFRLFRQSGEDEGFWYVQMFFTKEGLVVIHESGVALINNAGKLAWHERITWNDRMFARDDEVLKFYADFDEGYEWSIRVSDGLITGNKPVV